MTLLATAKKLATISLDLKTVLIVIVAVVISISATTALIHIAQVNPLKKEIERRDQFYGQQITAQNKLISTLAALEKYKIENNFDKMKPKDAQIIIDLTNNMKAMSLDTISVESDPILPSKKNGFFKRLFH